MTDIVSRPATAGLIARVQNILLKPSPTWDEIAIEPSSIRSIYTGYLVPLAAIGPIAQAIGLSLIGVMYFRVPLLWAVGQAIVSYVVILGLFFAQALIIDALAPNFGAVKDRLNAFKVSAYSWTPVLVGSIVYLLPSLSMLVFLAALYGVYLLYLGLPKLMKAPQDKVVGYTAAVVGITFVVALVIGVVVGGITRMGTMGGLHGPFAAAEHRTAGKVVVPGMGTVDTAKLQAAADQLQAQTSAMQNGTATVKPVDPQALLALMPQSFMGAPRSDTTTDSGGAQGMAIAAAEASYIVNGNTIRLKITDLGTMSGFGAMAQAVDINHTQTTETGYEKVESKDGRKTTESWDNSSKSGTYSVLAGTRIAVEAVGTGVDMATLKTLVNGIDLNRAQALATS